MSTPENPTDPIGPRFFSELHALFLGHIAACEEATGLPAITRRTIMEFLPTPLPANFEGADTAQLNYIDPPDPKDLNPFLTLQFELTSQGEPYRLEQDRTQPDRLVEIAQQRRPLSDIDDAEDGRYIGVAVPEGGVDPFVFNAALHADDRVDQVTAMRELLDLGLARPLEEPEAETLLEIVRDSQPDLDHFRMEFTDPTNRG